MPKKLRPAVDLMAFKCRTLKVNVTPGHMTEVAEKIQQKSNKNISTDSYLAWLRLKMGTS
jgi:hypothetical protein